MNKQISVHRIHDKAQPKIVIYQTADGQVELEINLIQETLWLNQQQMANLFGTKRQAITKHLKNIFASMELDENSVCSILEHTAPDRKRCESPRAHARGFLR